MSQLGRWLGGEKGGILNICLSSTHRESATKHTLSCISCAKKIGGEVSHRRFLRYVWFCGNMHAKMLNPPKNLTFLAFKPILREFPQGVKLPPSSAKNYEFCWKTVRDVRVSVLTWKLNGRNVIYI